MSKEILTKASSERFHSEKALSGRPATIFNPFGRVAIRLNNDLGAITIFFLRAFVRIFRMRQLPEILHQIYFIGARSATIVMLVGLFTGMVMGLQLYHVLIGFGSVGALGSAVSLSLIRELGPVLTAIMITARAGSAMTAEIGIQRISEQIDALQTMRIDPLEYLVSPRNKHFGLVGGFFTRQSIDEFASLLPFSNREEAGRLMLDFTRDFQEHGLAGLENMLRGTGPRQTCVELTVLGGLACGKPQVELDSIIEFARFDFKPIARLSCERGNGPT